jgi:hypothetical protein
MRELVRTDHGTLRDPDTKHEYPTDYPPSAGSSLAEAWKILDVIAPGVIPMDARALLAGMIAGTIERIKQEARDDGGEAKTKRN